MRTYTVAMNVTLSIEDRLLERARRLAQQQGKSLNQMIRDYLEALTGADPGEVITELERAWATDEGDSRGWKWNREELYDRPVLR